VWVVSSAAFAAGDGGSDPTSLPLNRLAGGGDLSPLAALGAGFQEPSRVRRGQTWIGKAASLELHNA
jgi:hypothetical protein